jgi:hypothetical protein
MPRRRSLRGRLQWSSDGTVTAAASDRPSWGCATGNEYTDFGRALFGEALREERSLPIAFGRAVRVVDERDRAEGRRPSLPRLHLGARVQDKLGEIEARLGVATP